MAKRGAVRGRGLRALREETGLSRDQLYRAMPADVAVTPAHMWRLEEGKAQAKVPTARALAETLSELLGEPLTVEDLFPGPKRTRLEPAA